MNDYYWLIFTALYALGLTLGGAWLFFRSRQFSWAWLLMGVLLCLQTITLGVRGMDFDSCPIRGISEIFFFLGWALNAFYLLLGRLYRMSIIGVFTLPAILFCMGVSWGCYHVPALLPPNCWITWHIGLAMLAYGAFGLSAVAGSVFLIQNSFLKRHHLLGRTKLLPPVRLLQGCMVRLSMVGFLLIIVSQVLGYCSNQTIPAEKWIVAACVSFGYLVLLLVVKFRGLPGRWMAWASIIYI
ncbi:MAG: cytochrome c biogenesis protein CcsA [Akkermansia sp.]